MTQAEKEIQKKQKLEDAKLAAEMKAKMMRQEEKARLKALELANKQNQKPETDYSSKVRELQQQLDTLKANNGRAAEINNIKR